jgi:hypothetical protein
MSYSVQPPLLALKDFLESNTNDCLVVVLERSTWIPCCSVWIDVGVGDAAATRCGWCCRR